MWRKYGKFCRKCLEIPKKRCNFAKEMKRYGRDSEEIYLMAWIISCMLDPYDEHSSHYFLYERRK